MRTFVYNFYEDSVGKDPLLNRQKPILMSISSLRKYNSHIKIYVYDYGLIPQQWESYQKEFNFEVIYDKPLFTKDCSFADSRSMQRLWTVTENEFDEDIVAAVSNNVIFLSDPMSYNPFQDHLSGGDQEGLFYHCPNSTRSCLMMDRWKSLCLLFLQKGKFQQKVLGLNKSELINENDIMNHLLFQEVPHYWKTLPPGVGTPIYTLDELIRMKIGISSIVLNESFVGVDKVNAINLFKELHERCNRYLQDEKRLDFSLIDLGNPDKVREMKKLLNLKGDSCFKFQAVPFWLSPIQQIYNDGYLK